MENPRGFSRNETIAKAVGINFENIIKIDCEDGAVTKQIRGIVKLPDFTLVLKIGIKEQLTQLYHQTPPVIQLWWQLITIK